MGYEVVILRCRACGLIRHLPSEQYTKPRRFTCGRCGTRIHTVTSTWVEGEPPDNVVPIREQ